MPPVPPGSRKLSARRRIKESREYARIKAGGRRYGHGSLLLNWLLVEGAFGPRVGVIVSRKVGNAVIRNRVKRRLKEVFRKHQGSLLPNLQLVVVARPSIAGRDFDGIESDFLKAARHARVFSPSEAS